MEDNRYVCKGCESPAVSVFDDPNEPDGKVYYCAVHALLNEGFTIYQAENLLRRVPKRFRDKK